MGKKKRARRRRHSGFDDHAKRGSVLVPPFNQLDMSVLDYPRDILPEHLWLAALADHFTLDSAHLPFNDLLDVVDDYWPGEASTCIGFISDFGAFPSEHRETFKSEHRELIRATFHDPVGRLIAFYPDCPARWLVDEDALAEGGPLDPEKELRRLRKLVLDLIHGKDDHAGHLRAIPLNRLFKHNKLLLADHLEIVELLPKYPTKCTEDEQRLVQSFARATMAMLLPHEARYKANTWPKSFWRHNYDLVPCRPHVQEISGGRPISADEVPILIEALKENARIARDYLDTLARKLPSDLYDPKRDEVLFGLFARTTRLFALMAEDPNLWARDTAGIMLRCLADTAITFAYLVKTGTDEDFRRFIEYGEGQEKLLMLHLQDTYPDATSLEGRDAGAIAESFDSIVPEVLNIELGHWSKKDTRRLAREADMEDLYRLVYGPSSGDLHGSWMSLKHSNLSRCVEPLHRFHRLPSFTEPPVFVGVMKVAQGLYFSCVQTGVEQLNYPSFDSAMSDLPVSADDHEDKD